MKKITTKNIYTTIAALLLVLCACWNIKCESYLSKVTIDKKEVREKQQAAFLQHIHENSKPYKQSLKMDSLFAQRLDISPLSEGTIGKVNKMNVKRLLNSY